MCLYSPSPVPQTPPVTYPTPPHSPQACERDVLDAGQQAALRENLIKLAWALVHSRRQPDVRRGLAILQGGLWLVKM